MNFYSHRQADFKMYMKAEGTTTPQTVRGTVRRFISPGAETPDTVEGQRGAGGW